MRGRGKQKNGIRYSESFKQQVVRCVEEGRYSVCDAQREFAIGSSQTIYNWLRHYGSDPSYKKVVRVETHDEKSRIEKLQDEIDVLKEALRLTQIEKIAAEIHLDETLKYLSPDEKKRVLKSLSVAQRKLVESTKSGQA